MSADVDGRLSDEQLQALASLDVETIQRIGDVADKVDGRSRREVLAMLGAVGVAGGGIAYGTRQATAQPDGSPNVIGTQSDRQDVWGEEGDFNEYNDVLTAGPGELQSVLSGASSGDWVRLHPGEFYDPGSVTTIPEGVTLDFHGAVFEPSSDYDGFALMGGAAIANGKTDISVAAGSGYTSNIVVVDTEIAGQSISGPGDDSHVSVEMNVFGTSADGTGTALQLRSDGDFGSIAFSDFSITASGLGKHVDIVTDNGGWVQANYIELFSKNAINHIAIRNTEGTAGASTNHVRGVFQPDSTRSDRAIWNQNSQSAGNSLNVYGTFYDTHRYNQTPVDGARINLITGTAGGLDIDEMTGGRTTQLRMNRNLNWYTADHGGMVISPTNSGVNGTTGLRLFVVDASGNLSQVAEYKTNGDVYFGGSLTENHTF